jgi:hypothetical protein
MENVEVLSIMGKLLADGTKFLAPQGTVELFSKEGVSNKAVVITHTYDESKFTFGISSGMNLPSIGGGVQNAGQALEKGSVYGAGLSIIDEIAAWRSLSATSRATVENLSQGKGVDALSSLGATSVNFTFGRETVHHSHTTAEAGAVLAKHFIVITEAEADFRGSNVQAENRRDKKSQ